MAFKAPKRVAASTQMNPQMRRMSLPGVGTRLAANEGWGSGSATLTWRAFHSGFGAGFGGGTFGRVPTKEDEARLTLEEEQLRAARRETAEAKEAASRAKAHVETERQAAEMLRTELASFRDQLAAEQEARTKDRRRAEQAEATVEVLKQQLAAFQEQLNRMRKAERAQDDEYRRLQDEHRSLARAQEEAKASVMKMWDQLEKKDQEVGALKSKLHGSQPSPMQGSSPVAREHARNTTRPDEWLSQPPGHDAAPSTHAAAVCAQGADSSEFRGSNSVHMPPARLEAQLACPLLDRLSLDPNIQGSLVHLRITELDLPAPL